MILVEDSRQQVWNGDKHSNIHRYCKKHGIEVVRTALSFGDYCLLDEETGELPSPETQASGGAVPIYVDTKKDMLEISANLQSSSHRRFRDCCIRAQEAGCQLVILTEETPPCGMVDMWKPPVFAHSTKYHRAGQPMTRANPTLLRKSMETMTEKYGVKFLFCDKAQTGRVLIDILTGKYRI